VNVADKCKKVCIFITENRFITVFKEMPFSPMAAIIILGIPGQKLSHDFRYALFATFEKKMHMFVHDNPSINETLPLNNI
jgi:hypothetical protein